VGAQYEPGDVLRYSRAAKLRHQPGEYARVIGVDAKENRLTIEREAGTLQTYDPRRLSGVSVHRKPNANFQTATAFSSPRHPKIYKLLIVISALSNTSTLTATLESGWTQASKSDSTSASTRILTMGTL